jgi:hypothetical protein
VNWHLNGDAFSNSWFLSGIAKYEYAWGGTSSVTASVSGFNLTALAGYHWVGKSGFTLRLGIGAGLTLIPAAVTVTSNGTSQSISTSSIGGFGLATEADIGYAF